MSQNSKNTYWEPSFKTLYEAYFQELASGALVNRWERIHIITAFLVAVTASGSAVAGWAFWTEPGWRIIWAIIAGTACLISIGHGVLGVPGRIKEQEKLRRLFSELRIDIDTFRQQLTIGLDDDQASTQYDKLRHRLSQCTSGAHPEIAFTLGLRVKIQGDLNNILKKEGYIK